MKSFAQQLVVVMVVLLAMCVYADETSLKGAIVTRLSQNLEAGEGTESPTLVFTMAPSSAATIGLYSYALTIIVAIGSMLLVM